jgi:hypothetical protein
MSGLGSDKAAKHRKQHGSNRAAFFLHRFGSSVAKETKPATKGAPMKDDKLFSQGSPQALEVTMGLACLMCGRPMRDSGKQWECRCGFFYKPLVPGTVSKKYRQWIKLGISKLCRACHKVEVEGMKRFCGKCAAERERARVRTSMRKKREGVI